MRVLVTSLLSSIPGLANVAVFLMFVFLIFGILGVQLFAGLTHYKCRVTPYPLLQDDSLCNNDGDHCYDLDAPVNASNFPACIPGAIVLHHLSREEEIKEVSLLGRKESPWQTPQSCEWPIYKETTRTCTLTGAGRYTCPQYDEDGVKLNLYCGSNYDIWENPRFENPNIMEVNYMEENAFGYTKFDNIGQAIIAIFQTITLERWVDIMYMVRFFFSLVFSSSVSQI